MIDLSKIRSIHFIGIGGIGMSALARMFVHEGKVVSGSDREETDLTKALQEEGVKVYIGQGAENIPDDVDMVVYTVAIPDDNPELVRARALGVPVLTYAQALGEISKDKYTIAVSGTHGKTTTTAMIAKVLIDAGLDPTVIVGSLVKEFGDTPSNFRAGKSKYLVVEACEYKRSFLSLHPDILVITNIEADHLDYFKTKEDVFKAFGELAGNVSNEGNIIAGEENVCVILLKYNTGVRCNFRADIKVEKLAIPGEHNKKNAMCALAVAEKLGIDVDSAQKTLENFSGTWRRFEIKGHTPAGALVIDDYAHHPTAVKATIEATKEKYPDKKIVAIFQPHLHSRTQHFFDEFVNSFEEADEVFIAPIYEARANNEAPVSAGDLANAIDKKFPDKGSQAIADEEKFISDMREIGPDTILLFMGAGDFYQMESPIIAP